jgi:hypothetical protein
MDVRVIIFGYHKSQIALINGSYWFVANFRCFKSRRLYSSVGKYEELGTYTYCIRNHGRTTSDTIYQKMSLFISFIFFSLLEGIFRRAGRLRPRPRSF